MDMRKRREFHMPVRVKKRAGDGIASENNFSFNLIDDVWRLRVLESVACCGRNRSSEHLKLLKLVVYVVTPRYTALYDVS